MAEKTRKKRRWIFPLVLLLYAIAFLAAANQGLKWFWGYMDAYEQTRPHIALNSYTQKLTREYVVSKCDSLIAEIDHNVQSEESCRKVLLDALAEPLTCAKKSKESTEAKHIYAILCGKKAIGTMEMERIGEETMGFTPWVVTGDCFDLSYLITDAVSVTVPSTFQVLVNGYPLSDDYVTEDQIQYAHLKDFYGSYSLPHMRSYQAGPFLGSAEMKLLDPSGNEVSPEELDDMSQYISNCTDAQIPALDAIADSFIRRYVAFTTRSGGDNQKNYQALLQTLVPNGELSKRMQAALDGLSWVVDRKAVLTSLQLHYYIDLGDGRYLCDLTYAVDSKGYAGTVQTVSDLWVIFVETQDGLKTEFMLSY